MVLKIRSVQDDKFEELDHLGVIEKISKSFEEVATGIRPTLDGYSWGELGDLYKGKNENYFYDEDESNEVDENDKGEGMTQEEIDERYEELKYAQDIREVGEYILQFFFPEFSLEYMFD